jgi:hypothetical protein
MQLAIAVSIPLDSQYYESGATMSRPVAHITAPWPTLEEIEQRFPIPKARRKEFQAYLDEFKAQLSNRKEAPVTSIEPEKRRKRASAD